MKGTDLILTEVIRWTGFISTIPDLCQWNLDQNKPNISYVNILLSHLYKKRSSCTANVNAQISQKKQI